MDSLQVHCCPEHYPGQFARRCCPAGSAKGTRAAIWPTHTLLYARISVASATLRALNIDTIGDLIWIPRGAYTEAFVFVLLTPLVSYQHGLKRNTVTSKIKRLQVKRMQLTFRISAIKDKFPNDGQVRVVPSGCFSSDLGSMKEFLGD
jgi:hypothetical protein